MAATNLSDGGALKALEKLENKHERILREKSKKVHKEIEITELEEKVQKLYKRKMVLKDKLNRERYQKLDDLVNNMEDLEYLSNISDHDKEEVLAIIDKIRCKKLKGVCAAYRLTGLSIQWDSPSKVNFRLDTFYQGQYRSPYYIEIESTDLLQISQHTIPYFIPILDLEKTLLNTNIQLFFTKLLKYLNLYTSRKEQVNEMKSLHRHVLAGEVSASPAFDYIEFTLQVPSYHKTTSITVKLSYESFSVEFPTAVKWDTQGKDKESLQVDMIPKIKNFKCLALASAIDCILS